MNDTDDTAASTSPLFHLDGIAVPVRAGDPDRRRLRLMQRALLDQGRWQDADLLGFLTDDLDHLPQPWARVVRLLLEKTPLLVDEGDDNPRGASSNGGRLIK